MIEQKFDINLINSFFSLKKYPPIKIISRMLGDKKMWLMMANRNAKIALTQKNNEHASQVKRIEAFRKLLSLLSRR